ncbi:MAG: hypothetical protein K5924_12615 [Chloroflexi bacterium]|nr:hypothetical protein [Chloroflexota bacterium]
MSRVDELQKDLAYWRRVLQLRMAGAKAAKADGDDPLCQINLYLARSYSRYAQEKLRELRADGGPVQGALPL